MAYEIHPESEIVDIESRLGVRFNNRDLLRQALTHESFVNEWGAVNDDGELASYERLEYLGDAVLNYTVAVGLFERSDDADEGELSMGRANIVCKDSLAAVARNLDLADHILLGNGELAFNSKVRDSVLEDSFEAIVGAIYVDQGYKTAEGFVYDQLGEKIDDVVKNGVPKDPKSAFQEMVQGAGLKTPHYETDLVGTSASGEQTYQARVYVGGHQFGTGLGTSKARAQKEAAAEARDQFASKVRGKYKTLAKNRPANRLRDDKVSQAPDPGISGSYRRVIGWFGSVISRKSESESGRRLVYKRPE